MKNKKKKEQCSNVKWLCVSACRTLYIHTYTHTYVHTYTKDCRDSWKKTTVTLTFCKLHKIIFLRMHRYSCKCVVIYDSATESQNATKRRKKKRDTFVHFRRRFFASDRVRFAYTRWIFIFVTLNSYQRCVTLRLFF